MSIIFVIIVILIGMWGSFWYVGWLGERPSLNDEDEDNKSAPSPGTREYTQQSIKKFFLLVNPFRNFVYDIMFYGGLASIIAICVAIIHFIVK